MFLVGLINHLIEEPFKIEQGIRLHRSIEHRLKNKVIFAKDAQVFVLQHGNQLESSFQQFYPECLEHALKFVQSYKSPLTNCEK